MGSQYLDIAFQYYLAGRSAIFAGSMPVAGNLFHHAVEMFLKYFLLDYYSAEELQKKFGHRLTKLWRDFKKFTNDAALGSFNDLVAELNKLEELRYPGRGYAFTVERCKGPAPPAASGPMTKGLHQYNLNLEELDEFVTALLTGRVTPSGLRCSCVRRTPRLSMSARMLIHSRSDSTPPNKGMVCLGRL